MNDSVEMQIVQHEEKLRQAMLKSDVPALDDLLAPDLIFTNHVGQLLGKQDDLEAHRSGMVKIERIIPVEQKVKVTDNIAIVSLHVHIAGSIAGNSSEGDFRFTRIWMKKAADKWQVLAAHSSLLM